KNTDEGNNDTTDLKLTVTLSNDFENDVTVKYKTKNNTATAGSDYVAAESKVKFKPGQKSKKITISVLGDLMVEPNEDFYVILTNPVNAVLGTDTAVGKIKNDDASFSKSAKPVTDKIVRNELQVTVFPNPAKNTMIVNGLNGNNIPIEITDMFGKPFIRQTINQKEPVNISMLPPGNYVIKLLYPGSIRTVKFVKQ
ncbi:MAG: Calx-beta domain-containing protein, partial [Panacibacter sp.]